MKKILACIASAILLSSFCFSENSLTFDVLEKEAKSIYSSKDKVLYYLDSGMLSYFESGYKETIERLSQAEKLIDEYYTKSISQNAASMLTNDSVIEYPGEDYENIYLNLFKALAYYKDGKWEEGFHELNAYRRKAGEVSQRHYAELLALRQSIKDGKIEKENINFHDSALGNYLTALYYRNIRDKNRVQYSLRMLQDVFNTSSEIYNFSIPSSIQEEEKISASDTRINFVVFSGMSPKKIENTEYYSNELILSLPELKIPKSNVNYITVALENKSSGKKYSTNLEQIENYGNICKDVFKARSKLIYYKSVARASTKGSVTAGSKIAGDVLSDSDNVGLSILGNILSAGSIANENASYETEHADLRHSKFFPGRADVGGITVDPGVYDITVVYYKNAGSKTLFSEKIENFNVRKGQLNLLTTASTLKEMNASSENSEDHASTNTTVSIYDSVEKDKIYFDIGSEPQPDGSSTYGILQFNWNKDFASNVKLIYTSNVLSEDVLGEYVNPVIVTKSKEFEFDLLPLIYNWGQNKNLTTSFGMSYQNINEVMNAGMFDSINEDEMMFDPMDVDAGKYFMKDSKRHAHIIAPRIGFSGNIPVANKFSLRFETFLNPIYCVILNQEMRYHSNQTVENFDYSGSDSSVNWSFPYFDAKLSADCFNFIRLVTQFSYQRLDLKQMDWSIPDYEKLTAYDDTQDITKLRVGLELLAGNKTRARVRTGIYYQNEWNKSAYSNSVFHKDKLIIGIGSER